MSSLPRSRRARQTDPAVRIAPQSGRITLVELDGSPVKARRPAPLAWPDWTDHHRYACPPDAPETAAPTLPSIDPEPESDAEWLANLEAEEQAERDRIADTYHPTRADLAEAEAEDAHWFRVLGDHSAAVELDVPDAPDFAVTRRPGYREALAADGIELLPISGGSPDGEPYEPTEADRREYAAFSDQLEHIRAWYDRNGDDPDRPMGRGFIPA
jgi:hypothetical protein